MTALDCIIVTLAALYTAQVMTASHGPFDIFDKLREKLPLGGLTSCFWCMIPWVSMIYLLMYRYLPICLYPFAVAGGAMVIRAYTGVQHDA